MIAILVVVVLVLAILVHGGAVLAVVLGVPLLAAALLASTRLGRGCLLGAVAVAVLVLATVLGGLALIVHGVR